MIQVRPSGARGHADHGWLDSRHSFSFADYYDPNHMGFRALRVLNEDRVEPGGGFGRHPHRDMEIISYVLEGGLEHKDSLGTGSVIRPGDVQRMSAGTGVTHSEANASKTDAVHFLQIWLVPQRRGITPSYEQKTFPREPVGDGLRLVASPDGREGSITLHTDAALYTGVLNPGQTLRHSLADGRFGWVQVARGAIRLNDTELSEGDGAALSGEPELEISATAASELLVFDLA